jgi:acid phosphatase class B
MIVHSVLSALVSALALFSAHPSLAQEASANLKFRFQCQDESQNEGRGAKVFVALLKSESRFQVVALKSGNALFRADNQRPSLNVFAQSDANQAFAEFVDFHPAGLDVIPNDENAKIEISLNTGPKQVVLKNQAQNALLKCQVSREALLAYLGLVPHKRPPMRPDVKAVGFDIDDTLLFTAPTFYRAIATGGSFAPTDTLFWMQANSCDPGCAESRVTLPDGTQKILPAAAPSTAKESARRLIQYHKSLGHRVYAITGRPDVNGDVLRRFVEEQLGIDAQDVHFEPDIDQPGNPKGKTDLMERLSLDLYYGDSDSDITDAMKAFVDPRTGIHSKVVVPVRFLRSPLSNNRQGRRLGKYHPGYFGEAIIQDSYR